MIIRDQRKVVVSWAKDEESWLMNKPDWWRKLIDEESWLMKKVDLQRKSIDKESWLTKKVDYGDTSLLKKSIFIILLIEVNVFWDTSYGPC